MRTGTALSGYKQSHSPASCIQSVSRRTAKVQLRAPTNMEVLLTFCLLFANYATASSFSRGRTFTKCHSVDSITMDGSDKSWVASRFTDTVKLKHVPAGSTSSLLRSRWVVFASKIRRNRSYLSDYVIEFADVDEKDPTKCR